MAAITIPGIMPQRQPNKPSQPAAPPTAPRPLTALELLALPLLKLLQPANRATLELSAELAHRATQARAAERELKAELLKESKLYEEIIITRWSALGAYHRPRTEWDGPEARQKRKKVQRVQFEYIGVSAESMYYKILTRKRSGVMGLFGAKNALPADVRVLDLISDDTLTELSYACHRRVRKVSEDPRFGVWVVVDRLQGMDGLPNKVPFTSMLEHYPVEHIDKAPLILGVGSHRQVQTVFLSDHPHVLIAGSTGGGKSNMVNSLISQLMRFTPADSLRFILIDLKRMEFGLYKDAPHLQGPVIFTSEGAIKALEDLITEVQRRAELLSGKAKELSAWNKKYPDQRLPRLVVVIDEFAELMLASGKPTARKIEDLVTRLVNLGRAVGVHAIICTQRPAVAVLPNSIKINMPLIISGRTQSTAQSAVIVDNGDAANLPIDPRGRMIYLSGSQRHEIQTPLIDDEDVHDSVRIATGRALGVINLAGYDPIIDSGKLTGWINANCDGWLTGKTAYKLRDYAITAKMFKTYGDELTNKGLTQQIGKSWRIKQVAQPASTPPPTVANQPAAEPDPALPDDDPILGQTINTALATLKAIREQKELGI